ncbi:MAG: 4'-phosphopantetheinyl transferase superfamily protein [Defluviitaleaceae bacterium]|nr:4'-phosphopantetheinyl transferase superfamily protein [Defluviitaleaceae bacterium]
MLEITILKINPDLEQFDFDTLMKYIAKEKRTRISKFHFFKDARNCLLADILARIEICRITGQINDQLHFQTNEYGKPYLVSKHNIYFNVSHAGNYVSCAASDEPVGIDIEVIKPFDIKIAERFFTADEITYIKNGETATMESRFYEVWTKKESRIKLEGKGLHIPLTSFSIFQPYGLEIPKYYEVLRNEEAICHVCTSKASNLIVKTIDTTAIIASLMHL